MEIYYFRHGDFDKQRWDEQLQRCTNKLIYAESVYLDHMSEGWGAMMDETGDYLMPLPMQRKMGINYSLQPPFTQQLGVFSNRSIDEPVVRTFINKAGTLTTALELYLNYASPATGARERRNYILDLSAPFDRIYSRFRKDIVARPLSMKLTYTVASPDEAFEYYRDFVLPKNDTLSGHDFHHFQQLSRYYFGQSRAFARKIVSPAGKLLSVALFLKDNQRIYYMMSANSLEGRAASANALLIYEVVREFAGSGLIFDFEGSEIPGVRFFFEKFSPENQPYYQVTAGRLANLRSMIGTARDAINRFR